MPLFHIHGLVGALLRPSHLGVIDDDPELGWGPLVGGGARLEGLACGHLQMLNPKYAAELAAVQAKHLALREAPMPRRDAAIGADA